MYEVDLWSLTLAWQGKLSWIHRLSSDCLLPPAGCSRNPVELHMNPSDAIHWSDSPTESQWELREAKETTRFHTSVLFWSQIQAIYLLTLPNKLYFKRKKIYIYYYYFHKKKS